METVFQAIFYTLVLAAMYLPIAIGLNLIFGVMHILNFAHGELYMLGGLFTWWVMTGLGVGFFPAMLLSILIVSALGILIERFMFRALGDGWGAFECNRCFGALPIRDWSRVEANVKGA